MVAFPVEVWSVMALVAAAAIIAILGTAANARREECRVHDLKVRVHELRTAYQRRLAELRRAGEQVVIEVEPVGSDQPLSNAA